MTDVTTRIEGSKRPGSDVLGVESCPLAASPDRAPIAALAVESPSVDAELPPAELLQAVSEASQFPLLVCRKRACQIVFANDKLGQLLGVNPRELVGRGALEICHDPADRETAAREFEGLGRVCAREVRLTGASGGLVWAMLSIEPLPSQGLWIGTLCDVTRRREAELRLEECEARLRGLVENSNELVFELDHGAALTYLSPNVLRLLGYPPSQLLGKTFDAWVHGNDLASLWEQTERARSGGRGQTTELRLRHRDGSTRWFCTSFVPTLDAQGKTIGLSGTARDISAEKSAAEELERTLCSLREAQLQLVRTEKMASLGLLMAGIAHEIRTPLGAVSNTQRTISHALDKLGERLNEAFPEALADSKLGRLMKVLSDSTRVVGDGSTRMTDIVQRLRKFTCADEAKLCAVDVNAIADDTLALIHHELKNYVAIQRCYGENVTLMGYPARLNQVLVNLLINAAQAVRARGNGKITLGTRTVGEHIEISVSDDGVGIPPENLRCIFACGFTTRQEEGGSGLGLAISKEIVDAHHGSLEVESQVGTGTTFTVRLPRSLSEFRKPNRSCRF